MITLDLRRALRLLSTQEGVSAPDLGALEELRSRAPDVAQKLIELQETRTVGFARLDDEEWQTAQTVARAAELQSLGDNMLMLWIGGSALGARVIRDALVSEGMSDQEDRRLFILDTLDPERVGAVLTKLDPASTVVAAISKSGGTLETVSLLKVVQSWLKSARPSDWAERITLVTDSKRGKFREIAGRLNLSPLSVPSDVGGRFSVLTSVGMLPAAFLGLDVGAFLAGARESGSFETVAEDPAWDYAALHHLWWEAGASVSALMSYSDRLSSFGGWFQQLWAESLGKVSSDGRELGWTPLALRGPADQHSLLQLLQEGRRDKLVTMLRIKDAPSSLSIPATLPDLGEDLDGLDLSEVLRAEEAGTGAALVESGRPVVDLNVARLDAFHLGALFFFFQRAVAYAGLLCEVDPFDQPGVEAGKRYASALLGRPGFDDEAERLRDLLNDRD